MTLVYEREKKKQSLYKIDKNEWLLSNLQDTLYDLVYKDKSRESIAGIKIEEYIRYCKVLHKKPNIKPLVSMRLEAYLIVLVCLLIGILLKDNIMAAIICIGLAVLAIIFLYYRPYADLKAKGEERLFHIKDDLPRFLSLLEKALDLPIDQAMMLTAKKFPSPLSEDLIDSINKVSLGANGWQETLVELAKVYNSDIFSDLILEIINSYEQGRNIRDVINRKTYEVEASRLYDIEAHDAKIKTMIFLPVMILKVVPLMLLVCLPMIGTFLS